VAGRKEEIVPVTNTSPDILTINNTLLSGFKDRKAGSTVHRFKPPLKGRGIRYNILR
jgi:hypothetical protein